MIENKFIVHPKIDIKKLHHQLAKTTLKNAKPIFLLNLYNVILKINYTFLIDFLK